MNIAQAYLNEAFAKIFKTSDHSSNTSTDLLSLLKYSYEESKSERQNILNEINELKCTTNTIKSDMEEIKTKIDVVLEKLDVLENTFIDYKKENRDLEEKLKLMASKLSRLDINDDELEDYYALAQSLYTYWDEFDLLTKSFLPLAEYLYSKLQKYEKPDYSPVILELCRALENELLVKIFSKYTLDLLDRKADRIDEFLTTDKSSEKLKNKTAIFAKVIINAKESRRPDFTLGQMKLILNMAKGSKTVILSPLLKDFVDYLDTNTESKKLLNDNYIAEIEDVVNNYRNPSAHPEFMTIEQASECRKKLPERIDYLITCLMSNNEDNIRVHV